MKRIITRIFALALAACMVVPLCPKVSAGEWSESCFGDVPLDYWACDEVNRAYSNGVVNGTKETDDNATRLYSPEATLTVAQFLTIILRGYYDMEMHIEDDTTPWYSKSLTIAERHGTLDGVNATNVNAPATRYQMAHIIYNVLKDYGVTMPSAETIKATQAKIGDWSKVPAQHQQAVATVYALGILKGVNSAGDYNGNGTVKRAVAAVIYCRMWEVIMDSGLTVYMIGRYGDCATARKRWYDQDTYSAPVANKESPAPPAGVYTTPKQLCATQPLVTQVALKMRYNFVGITPAASVNDAIDAGKSDEYPTMGTTDTPNRNGYYTSSTLDLSGCKLDYDVIPLYNKYRNEWRYVPVGDAAWGLTDQLEEEAMACAKYTRPVQANSMEEAMAKLSEGYWLSNGIDTKYFCLAHYTDASGRTYYGVSHADNYMSPGGNPSADVRNYYIDD